jgi:transposase
MHWKKYSNNDVCFDVLVKVKFPNGIFCKSCDKITKFYKVKNRPLYECSCGFQISPLKDTLFENSHIPLSIWFFAIFNMTSTRCGFSAAQFQRQTNINYKTAWRLLHVIRKAMESDNSYLLKGIVEVDETYVGWRRNLWRDNGPDAEVVMGMVERDGKARFRHIPTNSKMVLIGQIQKNISNDAHVMTDQLMAYKSLPKLGYKHDSVIHSRKEYVRGIVYTQTIESRWGTLKRSLSGTYRKTSKKWLQNYLNEFEWRYNHRKEPEKMFDILLNSVIRQV